MPRFSAVANNDELCRSLHFCSTFPSAHVARRLPNMHQCDNDVSLWIKNAQLKLKQVKILIVYILEENILTIILDTTIQ